MNLLFELLPLILFFLVFLYTKDIYAALVVLMVAMPIALLIKYIRTRKLDKMILWSTVILLVAGGLTLYFRNPLFFYWKPTILNWATAIVFIGSQFIGKMPLVQRIFGAMDGLEFAKITRQQWTKLNLTWALFFFVAGSLNIYVAYNYEEATWVNFKVFGLLGLTVVFMFGQSLWISHLVSGNEEQD